ncbi:MFS transporter [Amycolatopsis keratiniphila]|uniref:Major facilitator superfamily (MFS) profile domain-containing protein n=1 Tax=Amycolatopsis keratiniphila subsp. keratiniphila TaxID=227715 RepID=A0A1W2M2X4_9PSEU|nr:MFS transporter [Amycolatopsis keratiniphila]ONF74372.1 hypothetical protein AVR91_0203540 [Amycolatopsis keratiniphila subsp. keratiniphila]
MGSGLGIGKASDVGVRTRWGAVGLLAVASLIVGSEVSLAGFALPLVGTEFGIGAGATAWVLLAYALPMAALAIPAGRWVDRAAPQQVFLLSLAAIGVTGAVSAVAPWWWLVLTNRALQGLAAAVYLAVYLPLVTATVQEDQRGRALSVIATVMMIGSMAVAPLGGLVAEVAGWRGLFVAKVPLLLVLLGLGRLVLPRDPELGGRSLPMPDRSLLADAALVGMAITAGLLAVEQSAARWWLGAGLAVVAVAAAAWWCRLRSSRPVLALVWRRTFGFPVVSLMTMASAGGLVGFSLPFLISDVWRRGSEVLSVAMLVFVATASIVSPLAGVLADRCGARPVAAVGVTITVAGMLTMLSLDGETDVGGLSWRMVVIGVGMALANSPIMALILAAAPPDQTGTAGGVANLGRTLGSTIGPAAAAMAWSLTGGGLGGFHTGAVTLSILVLTGFITLLAARPTT